MRVIIVDDEPSLRDMLSAVLQMEGHAVVGNYGSLRAVQEAIDHNRLDEFDAAVIDGLFGKGKDVVRLLRNESPDALLVGYSSDEPFTDIFVAKDNQSLKRLKEILAT